MKHKKNLSGRIESAIAVGLAAGMAGAIAMTASQKIENKITGYQSGDALKAASKILDIKPATENKKEKISREIHLIYGSALGIMRGALSLIGLRGAYATAIHFATIWGGEMMMLPVLKIAPPVTKQPPKKIIRHSANILIYAIVAGLVFDAID